MTTARKATQSFRWSNTLRRSTAMTAALAMAGVSGAAYAGPEGGQVVSGGATISAPSSIKTDIHQHTNKAVINWRSFNTTAQETVQFYQPGASAIALNRVTNGQVTQFDGALKANGNVWLINESGVIFGSSAKIDVGGLVASTANISNADFNAGRYVFSTPGKDGAKIINQGTITAKEGGLVALVAPGVENSGVIQAKLGKVALAAGETFTLDLYGDQLINFAVPDQKAGSVKHDGAIEADGGSVLITANEASDVVAQSVNVSGVVRATRMQNIGGEIVIDAGNGGKAEVSGDVSARGVGGKGGNVKVLGADVAVKNGATIDVSGEQGGGEILVGGNFQGKGPERNARNTVIEEGAKLKADATVDGNGGRVIVWSNDATAYNGSISARGVGAAGKGGFAEVSGKESFIFLGDVDLGAESGIMGELLLDPSYIIIHSGSLNIWPWNSVENRNIVSAGALANALKNANVTLDSDSFIDVGTRTDYSEYGPIADYLAGLLLGNGNINVSTSGGLTTLGSLTLRADEVNFNRNLTMGTGSVLVDAPVTNLNAQVFNNVGVLLGADKLSGNSTTVNVKSNAAKIQQGVHLAGNNATVNVGDGVYSENIIINKSNLNLRSVNGRDATTIAGISGAGALGAVVIGNNANNITLGGLGHGFTIEGIDNGLPAIENAAVYLQGAHDGVTIQGNRIRANGDEALVSEYGQTNNNLTIDSNIITGETFTGGSWATGNQWTVPNVARQLVALNQGLSNLTFTNNEITGNSGHQHLVAIESSGANISGNSFAGQSEAAALRLRGSAINVKDNTVAGGNKGTGIHASGVNGLTIGGDNAADGNEVFGFHNGVLVEGGLGNTVIKNNHVYNNKNTANRAAADYQTGIGIFVRNMNGQAIDIANNTASGNDDGIRVLNSDATSLGQIQIRGNIVNNNLDKGIITKGSNRAVVDGNDLSGNRTGIWVETSAQNQVSNNTVAGSIDDAVHVRGGSGNSIVTNHISGSGKNGVWLENTSTASVKDNTIAGGQNGVFAQGSNSATIGGAALADGNEITGFSQTGVRIDSSANGLVQNNLIHHGARGIVLNNVSGNTQVKDNVLHNLAGNAISLFTSTGAKILGNFIGQNSFGVAQGVNNIVGDGILISGSSNSDVKGNKITETHSNGVWDVGSGIQVLNSSNITVGGTGAGEANVITNSGWDGIRVDHEGGVVNNVEVIGNEIRGVERVGIYTENLTNSYIRFNIVTGAPMYGAIYAQGGSGLNIIGNHLGNSQNGILVANLSGTNTLNDNWINFLSGDGIRAENNSGIINVTNNHIGHGSIFFPSVVSTGVNGNGVSIINTASANVSGNSIQNFAGAGVFVDPSPYTVVKANTITGGTYGVHVLDSDGVTVGGAAAGDRNYIDGAVTGIFVHNSHDVVLENNKVDNSKGDAVLATASNRLKVKNNVVNGSGVGAGNTFQLNGIEIQGGTGHEVTGNTVTGAGWDGISLFNTISAIASGNRIDNSFRSGFALGSGSGNTLSGNVLNNNWGGMWISGGTDADILGNTINGTTAWHGIYVDGGETSIDIKNNTVTGANQSGIYARNSSGVTVDNNSVTGAGVDGIYVGGLTGTNLIQNNKVSGSGDDGVEARDSAGVTIKKNTIGNSANNGVEVWNSTGATVGGGAAGDGNTITGSGWDGVNVQRSDSARIERNNINGVSGASGVAVLDSAYVDVERNLISNVRRLGVYAGNADNIEILRNTITGAGQANDGGSYLSGIHVEATDNLTVSNNSIDGAKGDGINIGGLINNFWSGADNTGTILVNNNTVKNVARRGIYGSASVDEVKSNTVNGAGDDGIQINKSANVVIQSNKVGVTLIGGANNIGNDGIDVRNSASAHIVSNEVNNAAANGIRVSGSNGAEVLSNKINRVQVHGIGVQGGDSVKVGLNTIGNGVYYGAGVDGINVDGGRQVSIDNNTIQGGLLNAKGAGHDGIHVEGNREARITDNLIKSGIGTGSEGAGNHGIFANNSGAIIGGGLDAVLGQLRSGIAVTGNRVIAAGLSRGAGVDGIHVTNSAGGLLGARADVSGNTVTWVGNDGIFVSNTNGVKINNNGISLTGDDGIDMRDSNLADILNNTVTGAGDVGIFVDPSSFVTIANNTVTGAGSHGIQVQYGIFNTVRDNSISIVGGDGVNIDQSAFAEVANNTISLAQGDGVHVYNSEASNIHHNAITLVIGDGVEVIGSSLSTIADNTVTGAGEEGIELSASSFVGITGNRVTGTGSHGILVNDGVFNRVQNNIVTLALGGDGIQVNDSWFADISGNDISLVTGDGIEVNRTIFSTIDNNTVTGAAEEGIELNWAAFTGITNNTVTGTVSHGILVANGLFNAINDNRVSTSLTGDGIRAINNWLLEVGGNVVSLVAGDGIDVENGLLANIHDNTVVGAGEAGIEVSDSFGARIVDNRVALTLDNGIDLRDSSFVTIAGNGVGLSGNVGIFVDPSSFVTVANNTVIGAASHGIEVQYGVFNTVRDNVVSLVGGDGIRVTDSWFVDVNNNTVLGALGDGIHIERSGFSDVEGNLVVLTGGDGIDVRDSFAADVNDNRVFLTLGDGIYVADSAFADIRRNTVAGAAGDGIDVENSAFVDVDDNRVAFVLGNGIEVTDSFNADIRDNAVVFALGSGIYVDNADYGDVRRNFVAFTGSDGIHVKNSRYVDVNDNRVFLTLGDGIDVENSRGADIRRNRVAFVAGNGIELSDSRDANIINNEVAFVLGDGINVQDSRNVDVNRNNIAFVLGDGIDVDDSRNADINRNRIAFVGGNGIELSDSRGSDVNNNRISFVLGNGIDVDDSRNTDINGNRIRYVGNDGIHVEDSRNVDINGNRIRYASGDGIDVENSNNAEITNNRVRDVQDNGIEVSNSDNVDVNNNRVRDVGLNGIDLFNTAGAEVLENTIGAAGQHGINAMNAGGLVAERNVIGDVILGFAGDDGIHVTDSDDIFVRDNTISGAGGDGIEVGILFGSSDRAQVSGNSISDSGQNGIRLTDTTDAQVLSNTITGSGDAGVFALRADNLVVGSNVVSVADNGIFIDDSQNTVVRLNRVTDATTGIRLVNSETDLENNTIVGGQDGLLASGPAGSLRFVGNSNVFFGQSRYFINLRDGFMDNQIIDVSGVSFNGISGATATPAQIAFIETKLWDQDDDGGVAQIFATPVSSGVNFGAFLLALFEQLFREGTPEANFSIAGKTINTNGFNAAYGFNTTNVDLSLNGTTPPAAPASFNVAGISDAELAGIAPAAGPGAQGNAPQGSGQAQGGSAGCAAGFLSAGFSPAYNMGTCQVGN
jgi:filamentous hemagglutinin family protein